MIRGQKKPLESTSKVNVDINTSIHNRFDIEVIDSRTGKVRQRAQAENTVLDTLWKTLLDDGNPNYFSYISYGSGSTSPSAADTSLTKYEGRVSVAYSQYDYSGDYQYSVNKEKNYAYCRKKGQISETEAVGVNISEIGIGYGDNQMYTKALLRDMNGNHLTITKTDTDIINIYATVYVHWTNTNGIEIIPFEDNYLITQYLTGSMDDASRFPRSRCIYNGFLTSTLTSAQEPNATISNNYLGAMLRTTTLTRDANAKTMTFTAERLSVSEGNAPGGLRMVEICLWLYANEGSFWQYSYYYPCIRFRVSDNAWYSGSNIVGEALGTGDGNTTDFVTKFPLSSNAVVKVDGSAVNDVNVVYSNIGSLDNVSIYFEPCKENGSYLKLDDRTLCYFNPFYEKGIIRFKQGLNVKVSDDLINWTDISNDYDNVPIEYQKCKYWAINFKVYSDGINNEWGFVSQIGTTNIHFKTPPAEGSVITADYFTKCIAKDENHVFDFTATIHLGEKVS